MSDTHSDEKVHDHATSKTRDAEAGINEAFTKDIFDEGEAGVDPVYQAKARILNSAFQEIGMGRYQVSVGSQITFGLL